MKKPDELEPVWEAKLTQVGDNLGFAVPVSLVGTWDMRKGRRYQIKILREIPSELPNAPKGLLSNGTYPYPFTITQLAFES